MDDPLVNPCVDEIEVADILLELSQFVSQPCSFFSWGRKRKRSDIARYEAFTATAAAAEVEPSPSPICVMGPVSEAGVKVEASNFSPDTPLVFSPSTESDEKEKAKVQRRKATVSIKKRRQELLKNLDDLTQCNKSLFLGIDNARLRYELLKQDNMILKQLVGSGRGAAEPHLELETSSGQSQVEDEAITASISQRRMGTDRMAESERAMVSQAARDRVLVGPLDLNLSAEEAAAREREDGKARAAQARFYRKLKMNKCRSIYPNVSSTHRNFLPRPFY